MIILVPSQCWDMIDFEIGQRFERKAVLMHMIEIHACPNIIACVALYKMAKWDDK